MRLASAAILLALWAAPWADLSADGVPVSVPQPGPMDLCPVCGMTVEREAPEKCPVCGVKGSMFKKVE